MNSILKMVLSAGLLLTIPLGDCRPSDTQIARFHGKDNSYSFSIPNGWVQIPEHLVEELYSQTLSAKTQQTVLHEAEFQLQTQEEWFEGPTILVQVAEYSNLGLQRKPSQDEFDDLIKAITGIDLNEAKKAKTWSEDIQNRISGYSITERIVDKKKRCYSFCSEVYIDSSSSMKSHVVGYFGEHLLVQLSFNCDTGSDWDRYRVAFESLCASFEFDRGFGYRAPPSKSGRTASRLLVNLVIYGSISLVVFVISVVGNAFRKAKTRKGATTSDAKAGEANRTGNNTPSPRHPA